MLRVLSMDYRTPCNDHHEGLIVSGGTKILRVGLVRQGAGRRPSGCLHGAAGPPKGLFRIWGLGFKV